ncbi:aspartate-semialdehyde dehydrogenase [Pseudodesulfovibrio piezophilus]|uniref:Aspartate-semialdehyde dehydrogenase n=1 Tax=Pseudodesulfovibrio piezophilus (strain DSM 21447 / JCM 15486 / C1TLV30) TaxID=1322246 RepID=M1WPZ2_PSEP2|nr:aspartate-semialdehyde dehydrogenase [Pseudodesulfovibrio piezophilus]CCH47362.1 Aspartate-semialdehyde dehydrogenase [Pseudodesulfovibrio piezophilus C1TLV30]
MKSNPVVAVCGATGAVGQEMLKVLEQREFPYSKIIPMASARSAGKKVEFKGEELTVVELTEDSFEGVDLALFSAGGSTSEKFAPIAVQSGCVVVDNSSAWRMDDECPLVVPEVNPEDLDWHKGIIANPNCSTIQMMVALKPIHDEARIKRVVVSTYQAVSGTGQKAIEELENQTRRLMSGQPVVADVYPHQIAFNCLPQIDVFMENGYTKEEMKMVHETIKIMGDPTIKVTATCVRVPVFYGHSESLNIETQEKMKADDVRALLAKSPGVIVEDYPEKKAYPMPVDAAGDDATYVGRIREDETIENGINMWVVSDNIRKGAALNTIQIAETLIQRNLLRVP